MVNFVHSRKCQTTFFSCISLATPRPAKKTSRPPFHLHLFTLCLRRSLFFQKETPFPEVYFVHLYHPPWCKSPIIHQFLSVTRLLSSYRFYPPPLHPRLLFILVATVSRVTKLKPDYITSAENTPLCYCVPHASWCTTCSHTTMLM